MEEHTKECKERYGEYLRKVAEYFVQWPYHCKVCDGWGGHYDYYDPSPSGVSLSAGSMVDFEPCNSCYDRGFCSRCGRIIDIEVIEEAECGCPHCAFEFDGTTDGLPPEYYCYCHEESIEDLYEGFDNYFDTDDPKYEVEMQAKARLDEHK